MNNHTEFSYLGGAHVSWRARTTFAFSSVCTVVCLYFYTLRCRHRHLKGHAREIEMDPKMNCMDNKKITKVKYRDMFETVGMHFWNILAQTLKGGFMQILPNIRRSLHSALLRSRHFYGGSGSDSGPNGVRFNTVIKTCMLNHKMLHWWSGKYGSPLPVSP